MSFTANFSVSQGTDVTSFTLTDISAGSDSNLTGRTVYLYTVSGSLLGGAAIPWSISDSSILIPGLLLQDYSLSIVVVWASSSPIPGSTYTKTLITTFTSYANLFLYGLVQQIAADKSITADSNFISNMSLVQTYLDGAINATDFSDQGNAQQCLDVCAYYEQNQNLFF